MRRAVYLVMALSLLATCLGCAKEEGASNTTAAAGPDAEFTVVNLKVPNMT